MVFSTPYFLFLYLPICLLLYHITPQRGRNFVLLTFSLLFYYWGEQIYVLIMFASIFIDFFHGLLVSYFKDKGRDTLAKCAVASSILFNLGLLGFFKYWDFFALSLQEAGITALPVLDVHLPIGISFYTFQTMSYTVDVYRGDAKAQKNIINFGAFVTLFPQLIAGPILKYKDLGAQLDHRTTSVSQFAQGVELFTIGLSKKVLIANNMGQLWEVYRAIPTADLTLGGAWIGVLACTFQIYFDFSGYSDMAVGLGKMLGFQFTGNFNYPYTANSITDFWRRWHISLSSWFREYLYIPLGGNRKGTGRTVFNLLIVWAATGFWHGASWNFLIWGLYFFVLLMIEKFFLTDLLQKLPKVVGHLYALFFVLISWAIFFLEDTTHLANYLKTMVGLGKTSWWDGRDGYYLGSYLVIFLVAGVASTPLARNSYRKLPLLAQQGVGLILVLVGLIASTAYLVDATYNPFLYFRF